jgi:nucleosome assembly protein 1-like 1
MADPEKAMDSTDQDHEDLEEEEEDDEEENGTGGNISSQLLKNPSVMAALQGKLGSMIGTASGYIESLPAPVKRRLKSLKKIQLESTKIEAQFYEEVHRLECKYQNLYQPLYEKRATITKGDYEPTDVECEWPSDDEELAEEVKDKVKIDEKEEKDKKKDGEGDENDSENVKGVPEFWLTIFKNVDLLQEMVQEHDEPALKKLDDVTVTFSESNPMGFTLHFHFSPNDYFTNSVLTKEYEMKCAPSEDDPFSFEGPEIYKCKGCTIDWKKGKNLTIKTVKKKQKHKSKGTARTVTKQVKADSFFNFFDPPEIPDDPEADIDGDIQELITTDFEIGHYIRERIIPRAVLFFTGEALEDDDFEEESDDENCEEGEEEEDDPDYSPAKGAKPGQNPSE